MDHISRGQLANMCRFVGIAPYGTDFYLRNQLSQKLRSLKNDDKVIKQDGIGALSLEELKSANRARGMRADTDDRAILERQLEDWLELSLERKLPTTLLILSRAFTITKERIQPAAEGEEPAPVGAGDVAWDPAVDLDKLAAEERQSVALKEIQETLASLPEEVVVSVTEERNLSSSRKEQVARKLEFLEQEEELIEEEIADRKLEEDGLRAKKESEAKAKAEVLQKESETSPEMVVDAHENVVQAEAAAAASESSIDPEPAAAERAPKKDEEELRQHRQRVHGRGRVRRRRTTCQTRGSTQPTARSAQRALLAHRRAQGTRGARAQRARSLRPAFTSGADAARRAGGGRRHARRRRGRRGGRRRPRPDHRAGRSHGFVTVASQEKARVAG